MTSELCECRTCLQKTTAATVLGNAHSCVYAVRVKWNHLVMGLLWCHACVLLERVEEWELLVEYVHVVVCMRRKQSISGALLKMW